MFHFLTLVPFLLIPLVKGECPDIEDIPIMRQPDDGLEGSIGEAGKVQEPSFTCARVWQEKGVPNELLSCNGKFANCWSIYVFVMNFYQGKTFLLPDNANFSGSGVTVGSAFVMPGCSLYLFSNSDYAVTNANADM